MFNVGDKVKTKIDDEIVVGVITAIHNFGDGDLYIVRYNEYLLKRRKEELEPIPEEESKPDEITITREAFSSKGKEAITSVIMGQEDIDPVVSISLTVSGVMILKELEKVLFGEK